MVGGIRNLTNISESIHAIVDLRKILRLIEAIPHLTVSSVLLAAHPLWEKTIPSSCEIFHDSLDKVQKTRQKQTVFFILSQTAAS